MRSIELVHESCLLRCGSNLLLGKAFLMLNVGLRWSKLICLIKENKAQIFQIFIKIGANLQSSVNLRPTLIGCWPMSRAIIHYKNGSTKQIAKLATAVSRFLDCDLRCLCWGVSHTLLKYRINIVNQASVASLNPLFRRPLLL